MRLVHEVLTAAVGIIRQFTGRRPRAACLVAFFGSSHVLPLSNSIRTSVSMCVVATQQPTHHPLAGVVPPPIALFYTPLAVQTSAQHNAFIKAAEQCQSDNFILLLRECHFRDSPLTVFLALLHCFTFTLPLALVRRVCFPLFQFYFISFHFALFFRDTVIKFACPATCLAHETLRRGILLDQISPLSTGHSNRSHRRYT